MIRFEKALQFQRLFAQAFSPTTDVLSAHSCILIEQVEHNLTRMTTIEPGQAVIQKVFTHTDPNSGGEPGAQFLIDQAELKQKIDKITKAQVGSLILRLQRGVLNLVADYGINAAGKPIERGRLTVRQYGGAHTDFVVPFEPENKVTSIKHNVFSHWARLLLGFGQFNEKAGSTDASRRTVLIDFAQDSFTGATSHKGAYMCYSSLKVNVPCSDEVRLTIEGRHFKRLLYLSTEADVEVYVDEVEGNQWVSFIGDAGRVSFLATKPEQRFLQTYEIANSTSLNVESDRLVSVEDLQTATNLQLPDSSSLKQDIVLLERDAHIAIVQASNVKGTERSFVAIQPTEGMQPWTTILVNGHTLLDVIRSIRSYISLQNVTSPATVLALKTIQRPSGSKGWLVFINPLEQSEDLNINTFVLIKPADESVADLLDTEE